MNIKLLLSLASRAGIDSITIELPHSSRVKDLKVKLMQILKLDESSLDELILLKNGVALKDDDILENEDDIIVMPPVSGGKI